jgi:hypothetical protein
MMKEQGLEWVTKVQGSGEEMEEEGFGSVAALTHVGGRVMKGADAATDRIPNPQPTGLGLMI